MSLNSRMEAISNPLSKSPTAQTLTPTSAPPKVVAVARAPQATQHLAPSSSSLCPNLTPTQPATMAIITLNRITQPVSSSALAIKVRM